MYLTPPYWPPPLPAPQPNGFTREQLQAVMDMKKKNNSARISEYKVGGSPPCDCLPAAAPAHHRDATAPATRAPFTSASLPMAPVQSDTAVYVGDRRKPWELDCQVDIAFPCATQVRPHREDAHEGHGWHAWAHAWFAESPLIIGCSCTVHRCTHHWPCPYRHIPPPTHTTSKQNEIDETDAELLIKHGCQYVVEGANMPSTNEAIHKYNKVRGLWSALCFIKWKLPRLLFRCNRPPHMHGPSKPASTAPTKPSPCARAPMNAAGWHRVLPRQGCQRRRRGGQRPGDDPEPHGERTAQLAACSSSRIWLMVCGCGG